MEIWAHRGSSATFPENTLAAFEDAARIGADAIEFDVQRTLDGELVVIHDETLNRTTNGSGYVYSSSFARIRAFDAGVKFHLRFRGEKVPSLKEVLDYVRTTNLGINIEIKNEKINYAGIEQQIVRLVELFKLADRLTISSFNPLSMQTVKSLAPQIETALLTGVFSKISPVFAKRLGMDAIHPAKRSIQAVYMREAFSYGLKVRPYTVNEAPLIRTFQSYGVAAIITDHPAMARKIIG